ncbi:MAG TPA: TIGR01777 family oxidoreductase [Acidimicrobiia bacterium]|nr:TIGR01777 family oxidoreductase [Acidimicrobiia bacterium]
MDVAITGATGMIGRALRTALEADGHRVRPLVRPSTKGNRQDGVAWDPDGATIDVAGLEGCDAVVHLAGVSLADGRWTGDHRRRIVESRVRGTTLIAEAVARLDPTPVLVSSSAVGYYGDGGQDVLTEESPSGEGFVADVCRQWEAATAPAVEAGARVAIIRTGPVLDRRDGLLPRMLLPFRLGVGGRLGSGRQWMAWISVDDQVRAIRHLVETDDLSGPFNLTAPNPVTNREFTVTLAKVLRRPALMVVPSFALKAAFGATKAQETVLISQRVVPTRLETSGFEFAHPDLEQALRAVLDRE